MMGGTVVVGTVGPGSTILKPLSDPLCYVRVEAVVLLASMEPVGKPVWVGIPAAESEILEIVVWFIPNCLLGTIPLSPSIHRSDLLYCRVSSISGEVE